MANTSDNDNLTKQLRVLYAQSQVSKRDMLGALVGAGVVVATNNVADYSVDKLNKEYAEGYRWRNSGSEYTMNPNDHTQQDYLNSLNNHAQTMVSKATQVLYSSLQTGIDLSDMRHLTKTMSDNTDRQSGNINSAVNTEVSGIQTLFRTEASSNNADGAMAAFKDNDVDYLYLLTQKR
ncbi:hypothetical protein IV37_GL000179 [Fructilactobacillus fructivorans]|uniref:hypothetical protein n=1 Tax=Fructilactobacillus fructivorans TaxID=1614 RepID=UPI000704DC7A|nr:hypothetical protein [Fructilactobacillus fructivorans]KRN13457.1 hypothetical protein IV37_GL000179 [Fructilactobacillus fructivorans]